MNSHKKLELSKETLRSLTSDLPSQRLEDVQGGNASQGTCISCLECVTTAVAATWIDTDCWVTR
jgi:hypothetical protein